MITKNGLVKKYILLSCIVLGLVTVVSCKQNPNLTLFFYRKQMIHTYSYRHHRKIPICITLFSIPTGERESDFTKNGVKTQFIIPFIHPLPKAVMSFWGGHKGKPQRRFFTPTAAPFPLRIIAFFMQYGCRKVKLIP